MRRISVAAILFLALCTTLSAGVRGRFMQFPDIHGDKIVFTYEGDLWTVPATGGTAQRLTSHPGTEEAAKFSPDGNTLVFTGPYDGGSNLYVMPAAGGPPQRVTYMASGVQAVAWTRDGKKIVFRSSHENTFRPITRLYQVSPEGEMPERLPIERGILCSFSPDGSKLAYNRKGREEYYWKRYKGGQYTDIWLYDFVSQEFTPLTDYVGKNAYPMWIGNRMYFVSDRGPAGIANLYTYDFATKAVQQVTRFEDFDVQMPSTDGKSIVFLQAGYLHVMDVTSELRRAVRQVDVELPSDRWQLMPRTINPKDYIHSMNVANDGKLAVFEARGDLFLVPKDENAPTRNLTRSPGTRERFPQISPDGKKVAFFSDRSGEYQLYLMALEGDLDWEPITTELDRTVYHLEWSPDGTKILFGNKDFSLFYVDVGTRELTKIDGSNQLKNDEFYWEVSDYCWSPDSRWVAYSFVQFNRNNRVFLYSLEQGKSFPITEDFYDCLNPTFDAKGDHLYFLSYRNFDVRIDVFEDNHVIPNPVQVMLVQLKAGQKPPFLKEPAVPVDAAAAAGAAPVAPAEGAPAAAAAPEKKAETEPFRIDLAGIENRIFPLPVKAGNYFYLKAGKGIVTWAATDDFGDSEIEEIFTPSGADKWSLRLFDIGAEKETTVEVTVSDWRLSPNREQMIIKKGGTYHVSAVEKVASSKSLGDKLNLDRMSYEVQPRAEWMQIFSDTWRWYRDFFYDPGMHGRDWKKMGDTYRTWVNDLSSRGELNWLLSQMVGELCVSHTYVGGGDYGPQRQPESTAFTGYLGADLSPDPSGYWRLTRLFGPTPYNRDLTGPLARPDINVKERDFLIAIDGQALKVPDNPYRLLQVTRGQKVKVTINSQPSPEGARTYELEPIRSEYGLRYNRWIADNIEHVLAATTGDVGYIHLTAMGASNIAQFDRYWRAFRTKKGLIIDVRGNGGGWTEYFMIDKLERKMVAYNVLKNMEPFRYPGSTTNAHLVVLTNEYNGSDGEAFVQHFKARKLGTVIGVPSWGGLVGIVNGQRTIDNGTVHQSNNAFFGREGAWWVENHGADPDILLDNDPKSATAGQDLQLERAISFLLEKIKAEPFKFPERPPYPVR
ncbi:MAG: S41 family peptidase [Planctomycetota bacterium]